MSVYTLPISLFYCLLLFMFYGVLSEINHDDDNDDDDYKYDTFYTTKIPR